MRFSRARAISPFLDTRSLKDRFAKVQIHEKDAVFFSESNGTNFDSAAQTVPELSQFYFQTSYHFRFRRL